MTRLLAAALFVLAAAAPCRAESHGAAARPAVGLTATRLPYCADSLDATFDPHGTLHVAYARGRSFHYTQRTAGQARFSAPVTLGTLPAHIDPEAPPQIAVWPSGDPCVLWKGGGGILMSLSADRGKTFAPVSTDALLVKGGAIEVPTIAVGGDGALHVVWIDHRDPKDSKDMVSRHLYFATSRDRGRSWTPARGLTKDTWQARRACPCCQPSVAAGAAGALWIAYRTSLANTKELALLHSADSGRTFTSHQVSDNKWYVQGCPSSGPSLAVSGAHIALVWMSDQDLFAATSHDAGASFSAPRKLGAGFFHQAAAHAGSPVILYEHGAHTLAWRAGDPAPTRVDAAPRGSLVAAPDGHFELIAFERGED